MEDRLKKAYEEVFSDFIFDGREFIIEESIKIAFEIFNKVIIEPSNDDIYSLIISIRKEFEKIMPYLGDISDSKDDTDTTIPNLGIDATWEWHNNMSYDFDFDFFNALFDKEKDDNIDPTNMGDYKTIIDKIKSGEIMEKDIKFKIPNTDIYNAIDDLDLDLVEVNAGESYEMELMGIITKAVFISETWTNKESGISMISAYNLDFNSFLSKNNTQQLKIVNAIYNSGELNIQNFYEYANLLKKADKVEIYSDIMIKCVTKENYEEAAILRDIISEINSY